MITDTKKHKLNRATLLLNDVFDHGRVEVGQKLTVYTDSALKRHDVETKRLGWTKRYSHI